MSRKRILVLSVLVACGVPAAAVNLLTNGDFNTGDFTGWYTSANPDSVWVEINTDMPNSYDNTPYGTVWCSEATPGGVAGQIIDLGEPNSIPTLDFTCVANRSEWASWGDAIVEMDFYEPDDTWVSYDEFIMFQNDDPVGDWTAYSHTFTVPPKAGKVDMRIRGTNWAGLYFDNVSLGYVPKGQVGYVYPTNGETVPWQDQDNCGNGIALKWIAAQDATGDHHVYLGTSQEAVANATDSDLQYRGTVPLTDPNCILALSEIEKGQTYYWRVDETTDSGIVKANSLAKFIVSAETKLDFLDYSTTSALQAVWGANATLDNGAMSIAYDNSGSPYLTEVGADTADLSICSPDWTFGDNELLILDVKGHDNMADSIYVTLESNGGAEDGTIQYPDVRELNQQNYENFRMWVIPLRDFADQGVVLTNVTKMTIGIGIKDTPAAGASGALLVDNIRLSIAVCIPKLIPVDINNDCVVNAADLDELTADWLASRYTVTATQPVRGPIVWYRFDEGAGADANDSSGLGYDAKINLQNSWAGEGTGYDGSNCLDLGNVTWVEVPIDAANIGDPDPPYDPNLFNLAAESTVSFWLNDPGQTDTDGMYFEIANKATIWLGATSNLYYGAAGISLIWGPVSSNLTNPDHPQDEWVHHAFVKSAAAGYMRIYQNGTMVAERFADSTWTEPLDGINTFFTIGAYRWADGTGGYVDGLMDDFRLYDYALSQAEVLSLAVEGGTATSPLNQSLLTRSDVIKDNSIDLKDFAAVASGWLQDVVYP